ncbi:MAG: hypothetical protein Kow00128_18090 [Deltaproteobacteria bacterium]
MQFFVERTVWTVPRMTDIRSGDFDGDGVRDLLYLVPPYRKFWIAIGRGGGAYRRPDPHPLEDGVPSPAEGHPLWIRNLGGDGREEIAFLARAKPDDRAGRGTWLLVVTALSPQGGIRAERILPLPGWAGSSRGPFLFLFRDVDGDRTPEIVLGSDSLDRFLVWKGPAFPGGDATGGRGYAERTFRPREIPVAAGGSSVLLTTVDLDGDGYPDIVRTGPGAIHLPGRAGRLLPRRGPRFGYDVSRYRRDAWAVPAEFNGDREPDLLALDEEGIVRVLVSGWGPWYAEAFLLAISPGSTVLPGDFNGDGFDDLLLFVAGNRSFTVLLNDGTGRFGAAVDHATRRGPIREVLAADLDGDGDDDILGILGDARGENDAALFLSAPAIPWRPAVPGAERR